MNAAAELMVQIDAMRTRAADLALIITGGQCIDPEYMKRQLKELEDEIDMHLRSYWELLDEDAKSARAEADRLAQTIKERDIAGIALLKELGYPGNSENVIEALCEIKGQGYRLMHHSLDPTWCCDTFHWSNKHAPTCRNYKP